MKMWPIVIILLSYGPLCNGLNKEYIIANEKSDTTKIIEASLVPKVDSITAYAVSLLGKSYLYGAVGPNSFDCSGFIYHVFQKFDIKLPRSSRTQAQVGQVLEKELVKKGDLLFFKSPSQNNTTIGHVGIVLENKDGTIMFIHSSTGRGVVIDKLERNYLRRFMEARRVL